jgi:uncharacterized membrane protein
MANKDDSEKYLVGPTRVEALSDGTFAIIITLLVLEIRRPIALPGHLMDELLKEWPSYLAYAVAFVYVGVVCLIITTCSSGFESST